MHRLLPRLVTDAAHRHAAAPAVVMDGVTLDYGTLEERSNRFARSLVAHGVRRGDRVAMWLPKSPDAIVALYGIMKAGAAYVPVDSGAPPGRLGSAALRPPRPPGAFGPRCGFSRAGGSSVPVDPAPPGVPLGYIARDCEVAGLV